MVRRARPVDPVRQGRRVEPRLRVRTAGGAERSVPLERTTLVVFLSAQCGACEELAALVRAGVQGADTLGVVRERDAVALGAWGTGPFFVADGAFEDLDVRSAPFFALVDADGTVLTEAVAIGASYVEAQVGLALAGRPADRPVRLQGRDP